MGALVDLGGGATMGALVDLGAGATMGALVDLGDGPMLSQSSPGPGGAPPGAAATKEKVARAPRMMTEYFMTREDLWEGELKVLRVEVGK